MQTLSPGQRRDMLWRVLCTASRTAVPVVSGSHRAAALSRWSDDTTSEASELATAAASAGARRPEVRFAAATATATRWADALAAMCQAEGTGGGDTRLGALHQALLAAFTLAIVRDSEPAAESVYARCREVAREQYAIAVPKAADR